jgi:hypothetical protein
VRRIAPALGTTQNAAMRIGAWAAGAIWLVGCSSSGSNGPPDPTVPTGTTTTTTGTGGGNPVAQAAASIYLTTAPNAMAGVACPATPHWVNVPFVASGGQQVWTMNKGSQAAVDGEEGASINCTVKASGDVFDVSASLSSPATNPTTGMPVSPTLVTLSTSIAPDGQSKGTLAIQDNRTTAAYQSVNDMGVADATCTFSVKPNTATDQLAVAPGRIWATVTCPSFRDPTSSNLNEMCSIGSGVIVLENCKQ